MRRRMILTVAIAAALFGVVAAPAVAQNSESAPAAAAAMKSKPKTPAGDTVTVMVTNSRKADLVELQAAENNSADWKKVLGALKAGQHASAKVPQGNNCRVDLHGKFADGLSMDAPNVDVCADKTVNLTD
jgi:opacity protein-like surface antigen